MTSRIEQRAATRMALVVAARRRFAEQGYADVLLADVLADVGMTKGALYHHFASKLDLFRAVVTDVQHEVGARVAETADAATGGWAQLTAGCRAFLQASTATGVRRIMLVDGPAVLGWDEWREIDAATSVRHLADALTGLIRTGEIVEQPVEPLARLISGALNEAALWLLDSSRPTRDLDETMLALEQLLSGLRSRPRRGS